MRTDKSHGVVRVMYISKYMRSSVLRILPRTWYYVARSWLPWVVASCLPSPSIVPNRAK